MTRNDILTIIKETAEKAGLRTDKVVGEAIFKEDLEWDSLDLTQIIYLLPETIDIDLVEKDSMEDKLLTINDLIDSIEKHQK